MQFENTTGPTLPTEGKQIDTDMKSDSAKLDDIGKQKMQNERTKEMHLLK